MIQILFFLLTLSFGQNLKIYVFDVEQCDSQLIVFPSGYSILIDAGEPVYSTSASNGPYIAKRIEEILGKKHVDVFVLSHYHIDHHGGYEIGGIWYLLEKAGITFGKYIDRNIGTFKGESMEECSKENIEWENIGQCEDTTVSFVCYSTAVKNPTKLSSIRELAELCSTTQIDPPDENTEIQIIISDAHGIKGSDGVKLDQNKVGEQWSPNENDFSICLRIQFGDFVYSTCGDLSGNESQYNNHMYHDVESYVADMVGEVDVYHVNHHGSRTSSNEKWSGTLLPTVTVFSCGENSTSGHPAIEPLINLNAVGTQMYFTNNCNEANTSQFPERCILYSSDIVITVPKDGRKFLVAKPDGSMNTVYDIKQNKPKRKECAPLV